MSNYELLIPEDNIPQGASFRYGVITAVSPLRVQLDGDTSPVVSPPATLAKVSTGDRVMVMIYHRRLTILGVIGGNPKAVDIGDADLNTVKTTGTYFQPSNSQATLARNYPANGLLAGVLTVQARLSDTGNDMVYQEYQTYPTASGNLRFWRSYHGTLGWGVWQETDNKIAQVAGFYGGEGSIPNATVSTITGWAESIISGNYMWLGTYSVGINRPGWYEATGGIRWATGTGRRQIRIYGGGEGIAYSERGASTIATWDGMNLSSGPVLLNAGDTVYISGWQNSGASLGYASFLTKVGTFLKVSYKGDDAP